MSERYLKGRVAWVTGGATGQGRAIALMLAQAGADVAIGSITEAARAQVVEQENVLVVGETEFHEATAELEGCGARALARALDVGSDESVQAFYEHTLATLGPIDILINAAGASGEHLMAEDFPEALWHRSINVNLNGPFRTIKRCFPGMVDRGWGRIVNIASTNAQVGAIGSAAYSAAKAGLLLLTRCVGLEGAPDNVTCNAISPGYVRSRQVRIVLERNLQAQAAAGAEPQTVDEYFDEVAETYPGKRLMEPEDIATVAAFLCRDEASGVNTENIRVSGGALF